MADRYLLESGSPDGYLLEDGSGVLLLDAYPASSTLQDNFEDNSKDATLWAADAGWRIPGDTTAGTIAEANGRTEITGPSATGGNNFTGRVSNNLYSLRDSEVVVSLGSSTGTLQDSAEDIYLSFGQDVNNHYWIIIRRTGAAIQVLFGYDLAGALGSFSTVSTAFSGVPNWLRLRHSTAGGFVYADTATSGASDPPASGDWTNQATQALISDINLDGGHVAFGAGTWASTTATTFYFKSINTATAAGVTHATTGVLTGPGSTIAGTAAHIAIHGTSGVLTGPGSTIAGTAAHIAIHTSTGALIGAGSTIVGTAARTREHATTGILTGAGSTIAGVAVYNAKHTTSGVLTGQGSTVIGSATRFRAHATTGALTGPGSVIVGVAVYNAKHSTTGVLTGPGSTLAGSAARFRAFATSGVLVGPGSTIAGAALRGILSTTHATSGALVGQPSIIDGTAARTRQHATSGILTGPPALIVGVGTRWRDHDSSGTLLGVTSVVFGRAFNGTPQLHDILVDGDDLVDEPAPPSEDLGPITEPSGQIVNHPPYPAA